MDFLGALVVVAMFAILLAAVPIAEGARRTRRKEMGLPPAPSAWQLFMREMRERRARAEDREAISHVPLGRVRVGLAVDDKRGPATPKRPGP